MVRFSIRQVIQIQRDAIANAEEAAAELGLPPEEQKRLARALEDAVILEDALPLTAEQLQKIEREGSTHYSQVSGALIRNPENEH